MATRLSAGLLLWLTLGLVGCGGGGGSSASGSSGSGGSATPVVTLAASQVDIAYGGSVTLTWSSSRATSCIASNAWSGTKPLSGSETVSNITANRTFELQCSAGTASAHASATVTVHAETPTLVFSASPSLVRRGAPVTLTWTTTNVSRCFAGWDKGRQLSAQGSEQVINDFLEDTLRVLISCEGQGLSISAFAGWDTMRLSGQILLPRGLGVDSDVNDPDAFYGDNDTMQLASTPAIHTLIVGYVNQPMAGPPGRSFASGDVVDYYHTERMTAGDTIRLVLPSVDINKPAGDRDDADLYLYDSSYNLVDASMGSGAEEVLQVPSNDDYYVGVQAVNGGMNYLLRIGDVGIASLGAERVQANFVPDEAIVIGRSTAVTEGMAKDSPAARATGLGVHAKAGAPSREMLVDLAPQVAALGEFKPGMPVMPSRGLSTLAERRLATLRALKALQRTGSVREATVNTIIEATDTVPTDPLFARQRWHYGLVQIPRAWDTSTGSSGVVVAIVDSGVLTGHPDLVGQWSDGYDFVSDPTGLDGDSIDADYTDPGFYSSGSWLFHGTHVAGTVGATEGNGYGGVGVAWGARLMPVRVLDGRTGTLYDMLQGIRYAAGMANDSGTVPLRRADVINLSLGGPESCDPVTADLLSQVIVSGIAVVAAAGNNNANTEFSPASCPGVISVAALGGNATLAPYSNFGRYVDVAAPGGDMTLDVDGDGFFDGVFSTSGNYVNGVLEYGFASLQGTSMAAPHVSGIYALMKSEKPALTPGEFQQLLDSDLLTTPVGELGNADAGRGAISASKAIDAASGIFPSEPLLSVTPGALNFGTYTKSLTLDIWNSGSGLLSITGMESSVPWAEVVAGNVDGAGLGRYLVRVTRDGLGAGNYRGVVTIHSSIGDRQLTILMDTFQYNAGTVLGTQHLRVLDGATGQTERDTPVMIVGDTQYKLYDLPSGRYVVVAGTDINNNGDLCDGGEICGSYPLGATPAAVDYVDVLESVDIPMGVVRPASVTTQ